MLFNMIAVAFGEYLEKASEAPGLWQAGADLKIDQIGQSVVANNNVLLLVQIDVCNVSRMKLIQELIKPIKEPYRQFSLERHGLARHKVVRDAIL